LVYCLKSSLYIIIWRCPMVAAEIQDEADIVFSDSAASRVAQLIKEEKNPALRLRVYITGGGCSGFSYGFAFDENLKEGDSGVNKQGVELVIDPMSYQYLMGSTVDYLEDLQGARFIVSNPNAKTTCGCGSSFSI
jgi:iron-sulfur cluster insertion protein